jgi:ribonucleoside-triphosphate reductase
LKVISGMYLKVKQFEKEHKLKVTLEESPAESASFRFAKVDLKEFPLAKDYVKGDLNSQEVYYTNSCHFAPDAQIDILERIEKQARFNTLIESGAITHVFLGEQRPNPEAIAEVVKKTWDNTPSSQITISPEFTICRDCNRISPGFRRGEKENKSRLEAESLRLNGGEKIDGNED